MREIPLTQGLFALVDDEDYEMLAQHKWYAGRNGSRVYAKRGYMVNGRIKETRMHRVILQAPDGVLVDHKDLNGINNQRKNLRLATNSQNTVNRITRTDIGSGYRGVYWHHGKWRARIAHDHRNFHLGSFSDIHDAARAYDAAALKQFGEFARLNFPLNVAEAAS